MPGSFVHRRINVYFSLGMGSTSTAGFAASSLLGKRISAKIVLPGSGVKGTASLQIYGMRLEDMNELSKTGWQAIEARNNTILVTAGDDENGMSDVFEGTIVYAWPDMTNQPQVVFRVEAQSGAFDGVRPVKPTSFKGTVPFQTVAQTIAQKFFKPRQLDISGIKQQLDNPYFFGSAFQQFHYLAKAARVSWIDENEKVLAAWPLLGSRAGGVGSGGNIVSKETGMVADPIGTPQGILVRQLFNKPYPFGTTVNVKSIIKPANGEFVIRRIEYSLESEMPHGEWFVTLDAWKQKGA